MSLSYVFRENVLITYQIHNKNLVFKFQIICALYGYVFNYKAKKEGCK